MSDDNAIELLRRGDRAWSKRATLETFWQEVALNFVPWEACFTTEIFWGEDFASQLMESTPVLLARDLTGQIGSMLRPDGKQWVNVRTGHEEINNDKKIRQALDWRSSQMMRIMYDRVTGFTRATKYADQFFAVFGNAVLHVDLSRKQDSLRFGAHHIKDCVWALGDDGQPNKIDRKETISARNMQARFSLPGDRPLDGKIEDALKKDPDAEFEIRHCVLPADEYDFYKKDGLKRKKGQWASVWLDYTHKKVLRETTQQTFRYVIPRWTHQRNSPYALSLASVVGLPDARLIQAQARALQEAAEKSINPPIVAYQEVNRTQVRLDAGGVTWMDKNYDERGGHPLQVLETGKNFKLGVDVMMRTEQMLTKAFFLDILRLPDTRATKSIPEVQFRIDEYIRAALPLFAPIEPEYNGALCHEIYQAIDHAGGFDAGPELPPEIERMEMTFQWDNPLKEMLERQKAQKVSELGQLGQAVAALEAGAAQSAALKQIDCTLMLRDAAINIGTSFWLKDEDEAAQEVQAGQQQQQVQGLLSQAPNISKLIDSGVNAAQVASTIPNQATPAYAPGPGSSIPLPQPG